MPDLFASSIGAGLRYLAPVVLLWLAFFFGRTLRHGATPLIERIARRGTPDLSPALCRYTRRLTAWWCAYFVVAAGLAATVDAGSAAVGLAVSGGSVLLFVGERWIRPWLFPGQAFPGLVQQLRDTVGVWRSPG